MRKILFLIIVFFYACSKPTDIVKQPLDKSKSKSFVLENGLKVHLISDPSFNVSAASVSVEVGSLDNPTERQALAHILEHMLFFCWFFRTQQKKTLNFEKHILFSH